MTNEIKQRLDYLREEIKQERISYGEIAELMSLAEHIEEGDNELRQWAGIPEGYNIINRESEIDNLITYIGECGHDRQNDKELMKDDLKMLIGWTCKNVYSSESTNDYIEIN